MWSYIPKPTKFTPDKSGHAGHTQAAAMVLNAIFPWLLYVCKKIQDIDCFPSEIMMIKESSNLTGQEHFLVYKSKLCIKMMKKALVYLEHQSFILSHFYLLILPRLDKGPLISLGKFENGWPCMDTLNQKLIVS